MVSFNDIAAVIVTRGDVDLDPILETLPYAETIIWDDRERGSQGCYGRYLAALETDKPLVYFQDDDLIFTAHAELLEAHRRQPDRMTVNMPSPWYEVAGYDVLRQALVGAGSLVPAGIWLRSFGSYLAQYPFDELFLTYCDVVVGILTPHTRVDLGYEVLPCASAPGRIWTAPGAADLKAEMQGRMLMIRDGIGELAA